MATDTRQRMIEAAALSMRQRGLAATSFTDVLSASGAARGAIYHHFPGGKDELAEQAVGWTGRRVAAELEGITTGDPGAVLREFVDLIRPVVTRAAEGTSCAVAATVAETSPEHSALITAADAAFASWIDALAIQLHRSGVEEAQAHATAQLMVTFLEGSLVLARAARSLDGFEASAVTLLGALSA